MAVRSWYNWHLLLCLGYRHCRRSHGFACIWTYDSCRNHLPCHRTAYYVAEKIKADRAATLAVWLQREKLAFSGSMVGYTSQSPLSPWLLGLCSKNAPFYGVFCNSTGPKPLGPWTAPGSVKNPTARDA